MSIKLYDLCGKDENHRFSPFCWRAKMAIAHKGVDFEAIGTPFTKVPEIEDGATKTVPLMVDDGEKIIGSFNIAKHLEDKYPDKPSLFGGEGGMALTKFVESWTANVVLPGVAGQVVKNVYDCLAEVDQAYFRESREKRFGVTLEEFHAGRDGRREGFVASLAPLRAMLEGQPFIGGQSPLYADYVVFGGLKWLKQAADIEVLPADDVAIDWFNRVDATYSGV